ncbi:unnamed protein product [Ambrosiozyma monospora]|uniref:Unnamed protein product n=1 Tax=Ambrosiozyma monospora TaxID=43982 RepID=A0A9W6YSX1_AMBMO|nr:unnamed protein product [Ambrosiozyma monospora]
MIEQDLKLTNPNVKDNSDPSETTNIPLRPSLIPLHVALMELLSKLQETVYTSRVVSVWEFLHVIEDIHHSRISRNQHDAQELLQLILETLENEYLKLSKLVADRQSLFTNTATASSPDSTSSPTSTSSDELSSGNEKTINAVPKFPFAAEISSSLRCLKCGHSSSANYDPMMILSLNTPQDSSIDLETLLKRTESEIIDDYSCLKCMIRFILANPLPRPTPQQQQFMQDLKTLNEDPELFINQDIPALLQSFVDTYPGAKSPHVKSSVHKTAKVIAPPKILALHLSRSIFADTRAWRNSCNVGFSENLKLVVDEEDRLKYEARVKERESLREQHDEVAKKLEKIEKSDQEEKKMKLEQTSSALTEAASLAKVVVMDLGDDKPTSEFREDALDSASNSDIDDDFKDEEDEDSPAKPIRPQLVKRKSSAKATATMKNFMLTPPSSSDGSDSASLLNALKGKSKRISNYKYNLKSVIRHQGSHTLGHYECYRRKPIYYKNATTGEYYQNDFPSLNNPRKPTQQKKQHSTHPSRATSPSKTDPVVPSTTTASETEFMSPTSASQTGRLSTSASESEPVGPSSMQHQSSSSRRLSLSLFRSRSRSRKSSVSGSTVPDTLTLSTNSHQSSDVNGLATPPSSTTTLSTSTAAVNLDSTDGNKKKHGAVKDKKLASCLKKPFWRISDSKVNETAISDVLGDSKAVYMLFYQLEE